MIIGDTNNPNGMDETMPMGPRDGTYVVNSNTAASPIFEDSTAAMQPNPGPTQRSVHTESTHATNGRAPASPAVVTIGSTNNLVDLGGITPMGPNDGTLIVNSDIAASPLLEKTTASAVDTGPHDDTHIIDSGTAASPTLKRKRKYSPARVGQRRRRWYNDGRDLNNTTRTPTSGGAQAGGDGGSGV